jgi:hypothetical protein
MPPNKLVFTRGASQLAAWFNDLPGIRQVGVGTPTAGSLWRLEREKQTLCVPLHAGLPGRV